MGLDDDTSRRFLMAFALKVGQRTRLHVAFLCVDGSPGTVAVDTP